MNDPILTLLLLLCTVSFGVSWCLTLLARSGANRLGYVDKPGQRKIHGTATPYGGGVAIFLGTVLVLGAMAQLFSWSGVRDLHPALYDTLLPYVETALEDDTLSNLVAILIGGTLMFLLGLVDDLLGLPALPKLGFQILVASALVASGVRASFFVSNVAVTSVVTVLWIVAVTNAFNLLDNMDGLSSGVALIASLLFLVVALQGEELFVAAFLVVFAGALAGFLWHNFPPARLFMGDAGSLFVGFILASLTVAGTYYEGRGSIYAVCMPVLVLGVPLFDTASVLVIRWKRGKPLFVGDTNHISHRLVRLGMTTREAVLTIYLLGLILGGAAILLNQLSPGGAVVILLIALGIIALIVLLETAAARQQARDDNTNS